MGVDIPGDVDLAAGEAVNPLLVWNDRDPDLVDRRALRPVVDIAREDDLPPAVPPREAVSARAHRVLREMIAAVALEQSARVQIRKGESAEQKGIGERGLDPHAKAIDASARGDRCEDERAKLRGPQHRILVGAEVFDNGVGVELLAIVELHTLAKLELYRERRDALPGDGEAGRSSPSASK